MPEGDSIHKLATRMRVLVGKPITAFTSHAVADADAKTLVGHAITEITSKGKNLLVRFDDGRSLHIHLRMNGRVFLTSAKLDASRSAYRASLGYVPKTPPQLRFVAGGIVVTGSRIPVLRLYASESQERRATDLVSLGPDLLSDAYDEDEALRRLRVPALGGEPISVALLAQRAVAGIGNVFKSEILFLEKVAPTVAVRALDDATLRRLLQRARQLLQANVVDPTGPRITRNTLKGDILWVYGRRGEPCLVCGEPIRMFRQGAPPGRSTYHCPRCQPSA